MGLAKLGAVARSLLALVLGFASLGGGCVGVIEGGGGGDGDPVEAPDAAVDAAPADFQVTTGGPATTELGSRVTQTIDVTGSGFDGTVALEVTGVPAGWMAVVEPATVELGETGPGRATLRVDVPTNAVAGPVTLTVIGTGGPGARDAATLITVDNTLTLAIGTPGAQGQHFPRFANGQLRMKRGATLRILNTDAVAHRIHSGADVDGFPHQQASMSSGADYRVTLGSTGSEPFYCHDHGQGTGEVRLTVE